MPFLYPNPASTAFYLRLKESTNDDIVVTIQDVTGKLFGSYYFKDALEMQSKAFSINHLSSGIYFIAIFSGEDKYVTKLVLE